MLNTFGQRASVFAQLMCYPPGNLHWTLQVGFSLSPTYQIDMNIMQYTKF